MPRLLHLADLHLGWRPRRLADDRAQARAERRDALLDVAVEVALDQGVHAVVIAGDLFESFDPEEALVERTVASLKRLEDAGVLVVTVPGNHDELTYARSVYRRAADRWPGLLIVSPMPERHTSAHLDGVAVTFYGLAYVGGVTDVGRVTGALPPADGSGLHVFVAHGTLSGAAGAVGERSLPLAKADLAAAGYDYVALGHIHLPGRHPVGRGVAVYPGCVGGKGLDDLGSAAWTLVDLQPGTPPHVRELPAEVQPLRLVRIDVTAVADVDEVLELIGTHADADALVRVELTGALPIVLDATQLEERARDAFFHLEVRDATTAVSPALLDAWSAGRSVTGTFVRRLRARLEAAEDDQERRRLQRALLYGVEALREAS